MMDISNVVIVSTAASYYFAEKIAQQLGLEVTATKRHTFGGGEKYYRIGFESYEDIIGKSAIFVGSTDTDENINELYRVGCALAKWGTKQRIFMIPFLGYSTMERAKEVGEVVTAKTIARQLSSIPNSGLGNFFLFLDLHVAGLVHYFEGDCKTQELYGEQELAANITGEITHETGTENVIFASADLGRPRWVSSFARMYKTGIALIDKSRDFETTKIAHVIGDVRGKIVIIYDDMTRSAGTIIDAAKAYLDLGAIAVYVVLSHLALNDESIIAKLIAAPIVKIITTNSHPMSQHPLILGSEKFVVADVSTGFARMASLITR